MTRLRWGVIGATSYVARLAVLPALSASDSGELVAVASHSHSDVTKMRADYGAMRSYDDYDLLLADPDVEAVYVPLPNAMHRHWTLRCAAAGKHVLCEKPLATSAAEAELMAQACADSGVLLMEAYMTPFHPRAAELVRVAREELGALHSARAVFSFPLRDQRNHRWHAEMGGGALADVGIYCVAPLLAIAGEDPVEVEADAQLGGEGVDAATYGSLRFASGLQARFVCSFVAEEQQVLEVTGEHGTVRATHIFTGMHKDTVLQLIDAEGTVSARITQGADPYRLMVEHFARAVRGEEQLRRGPEESIRLLRLLDGVRATSGPRSTSGPQFPPHTTVSPGLPQ